MNRHISLLTAFAAVTAAACTLDQATIPPLTGPSGPAVSLTITATPDVINLGRSANATGQTSKIVVQLQDATGASLTGREVRLQTLVKNVPQDCGALSQKVLFTDSSGRAETSFTAPGDPVPLPSCANFTAGESVTIAATPVGSNAQAALESRTSIRMLSLGVILPSPESPTARFSFFPAGPTVGDDVQFDATRSCPGPVEGDVCVDNGGSIVSYSWSFGDGATDSGPTPSHDFSLPQAYTVTLTVTNDRGRSAATSQIVTVTRGEPTAQFTATSGAGAHEMIFNASSSVAAGNATIVSYEWTFGDGTNDVGVVVTKTYAAAGTYPVTLTVTDSLGRTSVSAQAVTVP